MRPTGASYEVFYREQFWQQKMEATGFATVVGHDDGHVDQLEPRRSKYEVVDGACDAAGAADHQGLRNFLTMRLTVGTVAAKSKAYARVSGDTSPHGDVYPSTRLSAATSGRA